MSDEEFNRWLSAYVDSNGSFSCWLRPNAEVFAEPIFQLSKRLDDIDIVAGIHERMETGYLYTSWTHSSRPQARWILRGAQDCAPLVSLLVQYPLLSRKSRRFRIWSTIVAACLADEGDTSWEKYANWYAQLKAAGAMPPPSHFSPHLVEKVRDAADKIYQPPSEPQ
tara:strand:+ start:431 stop:931 length:501 start_codon:yes stop_codon:yes gene_type:complete